VVAFRIAHGGAELDHSAWCWHNRGMGAHRCIRSSASREPGDLASQPFDTEQDTDLTPGSARTPGTCAGILGVTARGPSEPDSPVIASPKRAEKQIASTQVAGARIRRMGRAGLQSPTDIGTMRGTSRKTAPIIHNGPDDDGIEQSRRSEDLGTIGHPSHIMEPDHTTVKAARAPTVKAAHPCASRNAGHILAQGVDGCRTIREVSPFFEWDSRIGCHVCLAIAPLPSRLFTGKSRKSCKHNHTFEKSGGNLASNFPA